MQKDVISLLIPFTHRLPAGYSKSLCYEKQITILKKC